MKGKVSQLPLQTFFGDRKLFEPKPWVTMLWEIPPPSVTKNQQWRLTIHVKALHDNRQLHLTGHVSQGTHRHAQLLLGYKTIPIPVQHPERFTDFWKGEGRREELLWWKTPWSMHKTTES